MSVIEGEALANKKHPGPQYYNLTLDKTEKHSLRHLQYCKPKTPMYV